MCNLGRPNRDLYKALDHEFGFTLDPCPLDPNWAADGLRINWDEHKVFCNPPWDHIGPWVKKAYNSRATTVFILPSRTDSAWFHLLQDQRAELRFFRKRVRFDTADPDKESTPSGGIIVAIVRRMAERVIEPEPVLFREQVHG